MRYTVLGFALGCIAAVYAVQLGDPQFLTKEHLETLAHSLAARGLLSGDLSQPQKASGSAHCDYSQCAYKGYPD